MNKCAKKYYPSKKSLDSVLHCAGHIFPDDNSFKEWHDSYIQKHIQRIAVDLDLVIENVVAGGDVLDCGAVPLLLTMSMSKCNYNVVGCDLAPDRYNTSIFNNGLSVVSCDIEKEVFPFDDCSFDAVIFNEIFEHLRINPIFTLSEVFRVLRPGGTLMLSSPNLKSLGGIKNFLINNKCFSCSGDLYEEYEKLARLGHVGHVREYTSREVTDFLCRIGFDVSEIVFRGLYGSIVARFIVFVNPRLSPFISYVAKKPIV